jgi:hypothetical protein
MMIRTICVILSVCAALVLMPMNVDAADVSYRNPGSTVPGEKRSINLSGVIDGTEIKKIERIIKDGVRSKVLLRLTRRWTNSEGEDQGRNVT